MSAFQIFTQPSQQALDTAANVLSGATLTFTLTGTSTPTNAYSDSSLSTPVANPLSANAAGVWAPIFLDPAVTYRIVMKTSAGAVLQTWDPANESIIAYFTQQIIGRLLYPRTQAEINASVTPTNYFYPPLNVLRYGTNTTPGTTDMAPAFQAAINVAKIAGGEVVYETSNGEVYLLLSPLDCTRPTGTQVLGFSIRGMGNLLSVTFNAPTRPSLLAKHTGHVFDLAGSFGVSFFNVTVGTDNTTYPKTCWFMARVADDGGSVHYFNNCRVYGKFSYAIWHNYGAEDDQYDQCEGYNIEGGANAKVFIFTGWNTLGLTSSFVTVATGNRSTLGHVINGGLFVNQSHNASADTIWIENANLIKIWASHLVCADGTGGGRSFIAVDTTKGPSDSLTLIGVSGEVSSPNLPTYGIRIGDAVTGMSSMVVIACRLPNVTNMIFSHANVTLGSAVLFGNSNVSVGGGINIAGTLSGSFHDSPSGGITVGTYTGNNTFTRAGGGYLQVQDSTAAANVKTVRLRCTTGQAALSAVDDSGVVYANALTANMNGSIVNAMSLGSGTTALTINGTTGFNGTAPIAKPTLTGAKAGNAALASVCTTLAALGLVIDGTT